MKKLECDICGGKLIMHAAGMAACDSCGMEYSKESLREKVQEIKGTVKIEGAVETTKGEAEKERLLKNAETQISLDNYEETRHIFESITKDYPDDYRGWFGLFKLFIKRPSVFSGDFIRENYIKRIDDYAKRAFVVCNDFECEILKKSYREHYQKLSLEVDSGCYAIWPSDLGAIQEFSYACDNSEFVQWIGQYEAKCKKNAQEIKEATIKWAAVHFKKCINNLKCTIHGLANSQVEIRDISHFDGYYIFANCKESWGVSFKLPRRMDVSEIIFQIRDYERQVQLENQRNQQQQVKLENQRNQQQLRYKQEEQSRLWERQGLCKYCGGSLGILGRKCKSCGKTTY